jgi:hypothetical protein
MKKLLLILLIIFGAYSCSIQKRQHLPGYHIHFYKFHLNTEAKSNDLNIQKQGDLFFDSNQHESIPLINKVTEKDGSSNFDFNANELAPKKIIYPDRDHSSTFSEIENKHDNQEKYVQNKKSNKDKKQLILILLGIVISICSSFLLFLNELDFLMYFVLLTIPIQLILLSLKIKKIEIENYNVKNSEEPLTLESETNSNEVKNFKRHILFSIIGFVFTFFTAQFYLNILLISFFLILMTIILLLGVNKKKKIREKTFNKNDLFISIALLIIFGVLTYLGFLNLAIPFANNLVKTENVISFAILTFIYGIIAPLFFNLLYFFFPFHSSKDIKSVKNKRLNNISFNYIFLGFLPHIFPTSSLFGILFGLFALYKSKKENNVENKRISKKNIFHNLLNIVLYLFITGMILLLIYFSVL